MRGLLYVGVAAVLFASPGYSVTAQATMFSTAAFARGGEVVITLIPRTRANRVKRLRDAEPAAIR